MPWFATGVHDVPIPQRTGLRASILIRNLRLVGPNCTPRSVVCSLPICGRLSFFSCYSPFWGDSGYYWEEMPGLCHGFVGMRSVCRTVHA